MQGDLFYKKYTYEMFPTSTSESSEAIRLTVADILTSMAMGGGEPITPTTFAVLDGLSGVPTRTTPTLTPTTLKNIEQAFLDVEAGRNAHEHEAGFVPPLAPPIPTTVTSSHGYQQSNQGKIAPLDYQQSGYYSTFDAKPSMSLLKIGRSRGQTAPINLATNSTSAAPVAAPTSKRGGGRRPMKDEKLAPEEVERRFLRRERNKQAAARCRKRRMDHTLMLVDETEGLEEVKKSIQQEIESLEHEKMKLERMLHSHQTDCKVIKVKTESPESEEYIVPSPVKRPNTLQIPMFKHPETPSAGLGLNFDSLMAGGTGLTPVTSAMNNLIGSFPCSTQNRNPPAMPLDLSSPDSSHSKLISL